MSTDAPTPVPTVIDPNATIVAGYLYAKLEELGIDVALPLDTQDTDNRLLVSIPFMRHKYCLTVTATAHLA
jgi:hypothetical protein